jgi:acyl carrier protein
MINEITEIIAEQLCIDADGIKPESNIIDDLKADSLAIVEMLMAIEEKYGVSVPDEDVPNLKTVQDIADYVSSNK